VIASDIRQAIVALLLAKKAEVPGRWVDVYVAERPDDRAAYVIIPTRKLKGLIAEELSALLGRTLDDELGARERDVKFAVPVILVPADALAE
jgi:hypothetical protein